ncbi:MAG TPA: hypothetical protein VK081_10600 [Planctomycetota bacterium]|nr:hypothetical protein [Planctomycetota bacterium]
MDRPTERWEPKDAWLGVFFLAFGVLIVAYAWIAMRNAVPTLWWAPAWIVGPLMLILGGNALVRALAAARRSR